MTPEQGDVTPEQGDVTPEQGDVRGALVERRVLQTESAGWCKGA